MPSRSSRMFSPSLTLILLGILLGILLLAGGASRADASGQIVVRVGAWGLLLVALLFGERPHFRSMWPIWGLTVGAVLLASVQLIPLPPRLWGSLPGRGLLLDASTLSGQQQPWRPLSIVPGATVNAISSLIVPVTVLWFISALRWVERKILVDLMLALILISALLGLLQFSGIIVDNPLINDTVGLVSGNFANRNHFALLMSIGCVTAPAWVFLKDRRGGWRIPVGGGLTLLFFLSILASGSRAGLILGGIAILFGAVFAWRPVRSMLKGYPRWVLPVIFAAALGLVVISIGASVAGNRAVSISRLFATDQGQDMRRLGLPVVLDMIREYFPVGTGFGSFDPIFRMHEPLTLLKPTYFNHAHNDILESVLDGGLAAALLLLIALCWLGWATAGAWRKHAGQHDHLARLGSAILLLILIASAFDYPVRTPIFMAVVIVASAWLNDTRRPSAGSALP